MFTFLSFLIVFGAVVLFHEMGHFLVAKYSGIKVYEFSIGFGPRLFGIKRKGTLYGLNLFPLGGLVRVAGLDETDSKEKAKPAERFQNKPWAVRCGVLIAGPLMNIVLAFLIFVLIFSILGVPQGASNVVSNVFPGSPAQLAGWQRGDTIVYFNGAKVADMPAVIRQIHVSQGKDLSFVILRQGRQFPAQLRARYYPEQKIALIGIGLKPLTYKRYSPLQAVAQGSVQTYLTTKEIVFGLVSLLAGRARMGELAGPLGIAKMSGEAAAQGWLIFLQFIALLSINLGVLNLLPIPALDGGRLVFLIIEKLFGRKISVEKERFIHYLGFSFLLLLIVLITLNDLKRIFNF